MPPDIKKQEVARPVLNEQQFAQLKQTLRADIENARYTLRREVIDKLLNPARDIDTECDYPASIEISEYKDMFDRHGLATRVIEVWPQECWKQPPSVYETEDVKDETEFEKAWKVLRDAHSIWNVLERADVLSGIGKFGIVLLGLGDGAELRAPALGMDDNGKPSGSRENSLLYLRPFSQSPLTIKTKEKDTANPRYGYPTMYTVQFEAEGEDKTQTKEVHWSRVVHLADNRLDSNVYGVPRLQRVYNNMLDVKKIGGGSAEMFWRGGFPGISFELAPEAQKAGTQVDIDVAALKEEVWRYFQGLQRSMYLTGITAKSLAPQVADPTGHFDLNVKLVAMSMGVPYRILLGSEEAKLASTQDKRTWNERVQGRRDNYVTPMVIRPLIDRLIALGILPEPKEPYTVSWPDLDTPTEEDKAAVAEKKTNALAKYVMAGAESIIPAREFLVHVIGMSPEQVDAIEEALEQEIIQTDGVS